MSTARVVFASDLTPMYAWFAPLSLIAWSKIGERQPMLMLVGDAQRWAAEQPIILRRTLEAAKRVGAELHFVAPMPGWKDASVAQLCRIFGYLLPGVAPDDDVMTADMDSWPLQAPAFRPRPSRPMTVMRPQGWGLMSICYLWGEARVWREIMGPELNTVQAGLAGIAAELGEQAPGWGHDESLMTRQIQQWVAGGGKLKIIERPGNCAGTRLDRDGWPAGSVGLGPYIDAHLLRPGWTDSNWPRLRWVLERLLPADLLAWADDYRNEYARALA